MFKKSLATMAALICFVILVSAVPAFAANGPIIWGSTVTVTNINTFADAGTDARGISPGTFGSEYPRMVKLANGDWLAVAAIYDNNGYTKVSWGAHACKYSAAQTTAGHGVWRQRFGRMDAISIMVSSSSYRMAIFYLQCDLSDGKSLIK